MLQSVSQCTHICCNQCPAALLCFSQCPTVLIYVSVSHYIHICLCQCPAVLTCFYWCPTVLTYVSVSVQTYSHMFQSVPNCPSMYFSQCPAVHGRDICWCCASQTKLWKPFSLCVSRYHSPLCHAPLSLIPMFFFFLSLSFLTYLDIIFEAGSLLGSFML